MRSIRPLSAALAIAVTALVGLSGPAMAVPGSQTAPLPDADGDNSSMPLPPVLITGEGGFPVAPGDPAFDEKAAQIAASIEKQTAAEGDMRTRSSVEAPTATPPDGTAEGAPDPELYLVPTAANQFRSGDSFKIGRPAPGGKPAGMIHPGLEDFYQQKIEWKACDAKDANFDPLGKDAYADNLCAYLIVPVDYGNPAGPTAAIGLLKNPATGTSKGAIFMDPGGPGSSGMELATWLASSAPKLHENFDFIGFDPRGVGSSLPMIRCKSSATADNQREGGDKLTAAQQDQVLQSNTEACYKNTGKAFGIDGHEFIANVGTANVVRDLDIARAVVGEEQINYLGFSYGTSIGYQYAKAFGNNIRALVNDGVVNPFENNPEAAEPYEEYIGAGGSSDPLSQIKGFQSTFQEFAKICAENDGFTYKSAKEKCALGTSTDVGELIKNYQTISQKAWGGTFYETKGDPVRALSFADTNTGTIMAMYSDRLWPTLNHALLEMREGNSGTTMMLLADNYYNRGADGKYSFSDSAFQTIWCTDTGTSPGANDDPAGIVAQLEKRYKVAPFTDPGKNEDGSQRGLEPSKDWCTFYQVQHNLPMGETLTAMPNILVISTTYDPATPYADGVVGAAGVRGTLLTVAANSHTSYGRVACATEVTDSYFNNLVVPTDITGKSGVSTKDIYSKVITGNECQVHSFRPTTSIADISASPGQEVEVTATGLVKSRIYLVDVDFGTGSPAPAPAPDAVHAGRMAVAPAAAIQVRGIADETGKMTVPIEVPADTALGSYSIVLKPDDLRLNDPTVAGKGTITIVAAESTPEPAPTSTEPVPTTTEIAQPAPPTPPNGAPTKPPALSATGVDVGGMSALAAVALLAGAGLIFGLRRRQHS